MRERMTSPLTIVEMYPMMIPAVAWDRVGLPGGSCRRALYPVTSAPMPSPSAMGAVSPIRSDMRVSALPMIPRIMDMVALELVGVGPVGPAGANPAAVGGGVPGVTPWLCAGSVLAVLLSAGVTCSLMVFHGPGRVSACLPSCWGGAVVIAFARMRSGGLGRVDYLVVWVLGSVSFVTIRRLVLVSGHKSRPLRRAHTACPTVSLGTRRPRRHQRGGDRHAALSAPNLAACVNHQ